MSSFGFVLMFLKALTETVSYPMEHTLLIPLFFFGSLLLFTIFLWGNIPVWLYYFTKKRRENIGVNEADPNNRDPQNEELPTLPTSLSAPPKEAIHKAPNFLVYIYIYI